MGRLKLSDMETKMITIPFDVERAKKIQAGEEPGKITTLGGRGARIVCWDRKTYMKYRIVALLDTPKFELITNHTETGESKSYNEYNLVLQVPEWTQYKDRDMIVCEIDDDENGNCRQRYSILRGEVELMGGVPRFNSYASCDYNPTQDVGKHIHYKAPFNIYSIRLAKEEEKQKFVEWLQEENTDEAKNILKLFFGIEEKQEQKFEFLQPVLVRDGKGDSWKYGEFTFGREGLYYINGGISWMSCIPYNEQTKHLLGTTDDLEDEE